MGNLSVTPIAFTADDRLPEGRLVIPFTVDFTSAISAEVDLSQYISVRQISCIKAIYFSWAGVSNTDVVKLVVYGTNQTLIIGSDSTGTAFNGFLPIYTNMPAKFFFSKTNGSPGGVLTCQAFNFAVDPLTWVPLEYGGGGSAGVTSFNTRSGAVVSVSGDYSAAEVTNALDLANTGAQIMQGALEVVDTIQPDNGIVFAGGSEIIESGASLLMVGPAGGGFATGPKSVFLTPGNTDANNSTTNNASISGVGSQHNAALELTEPASTGFIRQTTLAAQLHIAGNTRELQFGTGLNSPTNVPPVFTPTFTIGDVHTQIDGTLIAGTFVANSVNVNTVRDNTGGLVATLASAAATFPNVAKFTAGISTAALQDAAGTAVASLASGSATFLGNTTFAGHIISAATSAPTIAVQAAAGTGATVSITGNDTRGKITINMSAATGMAVGNLAIITFGVAYANAPVVMLMSDVSGQNRAGNVQVTSGVGTFTVSTQTILTAITLVLQYLVIA